MLRTILITAALSTGCSIALQSKPGRGTARSTSCSTSAIYPAIDMVLVGASVAALVASIANPDWGDGGKTLGGVGGLAAVGFTASGVNGIRDRRECKTVRESPAPVAVAE